MTSAPDLAERFPPLFTPVRLREKDDAFTHAMAHAARDGAGTIYLVGRFDLIEFAVVLEPEEPLAAARRVVFAGMNALAETIAADAPPERDIAFTYPGGLIFDHGQIGGVRLGWPEGASEDEPPEWLVFGAMILSGGVHDLAFSLDPNVTTLTEAGFRDIDAPGFAARFCRHLMVEIEEWHEVGFKGIGARYLKRLTRADSDGLRGIERNGDLIVQSKATGARVQTDFIQQLKAAEWYDPVLQGPKL